MIIYGTKSTNIHNEKVSGVLCDHCDEKQSHTFNFFSKYAHIYWIPLFPLSKVGLSECNNCKSTNDKKHMNKELLFAYSNVKANSKRPWWHWVGLLSIVLLFWIAPVILTMTRN